MQFLWTLLDFFLSAVAFQRLLDTNDASGLQTAIFSGNDVLNGSSGDDVLWGDPPQHQVRHLDINESGIFCKWTPQHPCFFLTRRHDGYY